jgi:hypothetical protein
MPELIAWPFPLPERFTERLGYERAVETFESPAMRLYLVEVLRRDGIDAPLSAPTGPRRYVALYWEPAGDELAFEDGAHSGAGQLDHWPFLDYLHGGQSFGPIDGWLIEHQVDLGSSEEPATHALVVDREANAAWVAPIARARTIVRAQDPEARP